MTRPTTPAYCDGIGAPPPVGTPTITTLPDGSVMAGGVAALRERIRELEAEVERLRKALGPFAAASDRIPSNARDHDMARDWRITPTIGQLRRARAVLKGETP